MKAETLQGIKYPFMSEISLSLSSDGSYYSMKTFTPFLLFFSIISLVVWLLSQFTTWISHQILLIQGFFFCIFLIGHRLYSISRSRPATQFHIFYFTSMSLRFLGSIIFLMILVTRTDNQKITLIVDFLLLYLLYTGFEIYFLINNLRTDFKKGDESK